MSEDDILNPHFSIGLYIRNRLLYPTNERMLDSCRTAAMDKYLHWDQAPGVIIKKLWEKLKATHKNIDYELNIIDGKIPEITDASPGIRERCGC